MGDGRLGAAMDESKLERLRPVGRISHYLITTREEKTETDGV